MRELTIAEMRTITGGTLPPTGANKPPGWGCTDTFNGCDDMYGNHFHDFLSLDGKSSGEGGSKGGIGGVLDAIQGAFDHIVGKLGQFELHIKTNPAEEYHGPALDQWGNPIRDRYGNVYQVDKHKDGSWELIMNGSPVLTIPK